MNATAGWNIWGKTGDRVRQFTVAKASEGDAMAALRTKHPDVEVLFRHTMAESREIKFLRMTDGQVTELILLESSKGGEMTPGGVTISKPMK
jgi:hypothetical protein